ncbi:PQQ-binding-like beta-propeller repeat protein [Verrucomicrobiota bacterium]
MKKLMFIYCVFISMTFSAFAGTGQEILDKSGVKGGLVVHIGCKDAELTSALYGGEQYLVHGLDTDQKKVDAARKYIQSKGLYGKISIDTFDGLNLPYSDNLVNLIVVNSAFRVPNSELERVLAPRGVVLVKQPNTLKPDTRHLTPQSPSGLKDWTMFKKLVPKEIDDWTHYLHDADNNPVSTDKVVAPPRSLQWVGKPLWGRSHEHTSSLQAMVSANGRNFYLMDEGPKESIQLPPEWILTARDAFSGVVLWRRPVPDWYNHLFPLKSGPIQNTRRLVASGNKLYAALGLNEPMIILDAATGKVLKTCEDTKTTEEILVSSGRVYALVRAEQKTINYAQENANCWTERDRASRRWGWDKKERSIVALDAETGEKIWEHKSIVVPFSLVANEKKIIYHEGQAIVCLNPLDGKKVWRKEIKNGIGGAITSSGAMVVLKNDVLLVGTKRMINAYSADTGEFLWSSDFPASGHFSPADMFVVGDLVWGAHIANVRDSGIFKGYDIRTGKVKKSFLPGLKIAAMHQRCYQGKATERYFITSWNGTEFVDREAETWDMNNWVRGGCFYGVMPANGMLYVPPDACACYYQSRLPGMKALSGEKQTVVQNPPPRLEQGSGFGKNPKSEIRNPKLEDWPMYRHDSARSGSTVSKVPADLKRIWTVGLAGELTQPVVVAGNLYVADKGSHVLYCLDSGSGKQKWSYTVGGRIDSPPTFYKGTLLFGSADGFVYCLKADHGELVWRFRVAPYDQRIVAFNQVESKWPVVGGVMIYGDVAYAVAGRSMFLDGGLRLIRLDPLTGKLLSENAMDEFVPGTKDNLQTKISGFGGRGALQKNMPTAQPDMLSCDGKFVYMRAQRFDLNGKRTHLVPEGMKSQRGEGIHLFSPTGFLDDSWFHRSYWIYGRAAGEGWSQWFVPGRMVPSGRILAYNDDAVFGYARDPEYLVNSSVLEYRLYSAKKTPNPESKLIGVVVDWKARAGAEEAELTAVDYNWKIERPPVMARAMVLAGKTLFVAGPPDVADEKKMWGHSNEPEFKKRMKEQSLAFKGERGGMLWAVSAVDGSKQAEYKLDTVPVFDGMSAADGKLFISLADGTLICMGKK